MLLTGRDTLGSELVTFCSDRLIGDADVSSPQAHIHYEAAPGPDGLFNDLIVAVWRGVSVRSNRPDQVLRLRVRSDSAVTEVWHGGQYDIRHAGGAHSVLPYIPNYVGILQHLTTALRSQGTPSANLPVIDITTNRVGLAKLRRLGADSSLIAVGATSWIVQHPGGGDFQSARTVDSTVLVVAEPLRNRAEADARCELPGFIVPSAGHERHQTL